MLRDLVQEFRELGLRGTAFRVGWELKKRSGALQLLEAKPTRRAWVDSGRWTTRLPFADPVTTAAALDGRIPRGDLEALRGRALAAAEGRIRCFGRWVGDYGRPLDWHRNPLNGERWNAGLHWTKVLGDSPRAGDVKLTWELARFPQAWEMARAAAYFPELAGSLASAVQGQFESFVRDNPFPLGVHWASGQETAMRLVAWVFALDALLEDSAEVSAARATVSEGLELGAQHIEHHLDYARVAVFNNHLLWEALGLYLAGVLLDEGRWRQLGRGILVAEAGRQFYADGGYIQLSHNYHRVALQSLLIAALLARAAGESVAPEWLAAINRSVEFLFQHQNPVDGRLPNYGGNDGALPVLLSTCDYADFRPTLQAASLLARGERLYPPGPWDETAAWLLGPGSLDRPLAARPRRSTSFTRTGFHVLRGREERSFVAFRCGSIRDRFSQIDMLHVDVWWRGLNLLLDGGSYLYNGPAAWHDHFVRTESHNTVVVDGHDQMLHFRQFKSLYWTRANLLGFHDEPGWACASGEHLGFARHPGGCVHRRSVLFVKDDLLIVADRVTGEGTHQVRLHWLATQTDATWRDTDTGGTFETREGPFSIGVYDLDARPVRVSSVAGREDPPRGWVSRYYAEKAPAASLVSEGHLALPATFLTVMGAGSPRCQRQGQRYAVTQGEREVSFALDDGLLSLIDSKDGTRP